MSQIIPTVVGDAYAITFDASLSGVQVFFVARWRSGSSGWYLSASLPDGTSLGDGVRLCPGSEVGIDLTKDGAPSGLLYCIGEDLIRRDQLGVSAWLAWVPS